ncbi:MAG: uroporphyrinogen decarboxylase family protein [Mahellales bacterium]
MDGRERIKAIFNKEPVDRTGFWLGNPADDTKKIYYEYFGIKDDLAELDNSHEDDTVLLTKKSGRADLELGLKLGNDFMWYSPELELSSWKHPEGKPMFDVLGGKPRESLSQPGIFAECENVKEIEDFPWPDPKYLDFSSTIKKIDEAREHGLAIFGGMWMPFFHVLADFFGMDNYFMKMYTHPKVVEAATERILDFYLEANKRCLDAMGSKLDAAFFGNDLGSQLDLMISPDAFKRFILPGIKRIVEQAKSYNLKVVLHSCGAITKIIPMLIDAGIDGLHPLQAKAKGMDAQSLAREYGNDLVFIGGVDTQDLLPFGTPEQVKAEVRRLKKIFGQGFVVSPSHEALLPNVSPENAIAMSQAALE